jgi:hypothetical protein
MFVADRRGFLIFPRRGAAIGAIRAVSPLRDDTFEIPFTCHGKQIAAAFLNVIDTSTRTPCAA